MKAESKPSESTEIQGGGERGVSKSKAHKAKDRSRARNTMGQGKKASNDGAMGSMGKHQSTGDGGASNW